MKLFRKTRRFLHNWVVKKIRAILLSEGLIQESTILSSSFKKFGVGSKFWGKNHFITGHEFFEIGNNVHINDNSYIVANGGLVIGDNTHISRNFVLYTRNHNYQGNLLPYDDSYINKAVVIGRNVWIGINVTVVPGTRIGDGVVVGMGSIVSGEIPPLSIITMPKASIIKMRDRHHYQILDENFLFAGADGERFIDKSKPSVLTKVGDIVFGARSSKLLLKNNDLIFVRKQFFPTTHGKSAYENELTYLRRFQAFSWCPRLIDVGSLHLDIEYCGLNLSSLQFDELKLEDCLSKILLGLIELFHDGCSHRDLHVGNIFMSETGQIKFIDFETAVEHKFRGPFLESYDITGKGLDSPYGTNKMHFFSSSEKSLARYFGVSNLVELELKYSSLFCALLLNESSNFFTRKESAGRHTLRLKKIYASLSLPYFNIPVSFSQRNTRARILRFGITKDMLNGKRVIDIGCNFGANLMQLNEFGPSFSLGLEVDPGKVWLGNLISSYCGLRNIHFEAFDVEMSDYSRIRLDEFDIAFCLALVGHLKKTDGLFSLLERVRPKIIFFEGNAGTDIDIIESEFERIGYLSHDFLGYSNDEASTVNNVRPLWIFRE